MRGLNLKFLINLKLCRVVVSVGKFRKKLTYSFYLPRGAKRTSFSGNKTYSFFSRFRFTVAIVDRLVKNGLIN